MLAKESAEPTTTMLEAPIHAKRGPGHRRNEGDTRGGGEDARESGESGRRRRGGGGKRRRGARVYGEGELAVESRGGGGGGGGEGDEGKEARETAESATAAELYEMDRQTAERRGFSGSA
nr:unnamed protein product [Digitaria exilis]